MRKIIITEATLSNAPKLSFREKLETARLLDSINTDIIETVSLNGEKSDEILVKTIAAQTSNAIVSCPVTDGNVDRAWKAVSPAKKPRLNVKMPVSVVNMEYAAHLKAPKMLEWIRATVAAAKAKCADVEFTALDATRAEDEFLASAITTAVEAGAQTVTVSDDEGTMLPGEFGQFISNLKVNCASLDNAVLGVCTSDRMSMAEACAFEAIKAGASQVTVRCAGKNMPAYGIFVDIINTKGDSVGVCVGSDITALKRTSDIINRFSESSSAENAAFPQLPQAEESRLELTAASDIQTVSKAAVQLGYELSAEDLAKVYERFTGIAQKKNVDARELDAIIATVALQVPPTYTLSSYVVNSGNIITATAHVVLDKNGEKEQGVSVGNGPIDAAFMAIEKLIGHHYELDDFSIQSVTGGHEAVGEALVRLRDGGKLYSGRGISTDIVGAAIRAYINALNKIVYREN
ncbi:MAG: hypothetical protein II920_00360 [Clostridia bacterium]|nr:hypothetical protein [Clostridia bacterium]